MNYIKFWFACIMLTQKGAVLAFVLLDVKVQVLLTAFRIGKRLVYFYRKSPLKTGCQRVQFEAGAPPSKRVVLMFRSMNDCCQLLPVVIACKIYYGQNGSYTWWIQ